MTEHYDLANLRQPFPGAVSIVSASESGMREIICLLNAEGVGTSQTLCVAEHARSPDAQERAVLASLATVQGEPATEVVTLLCQAPSPETANRILAQVEDSDKPTVVCFLGSEQRAIWRAGAIPAARLDEAAFRAAAWVRGWDQALITSRLEDHDEQFAALASELKTWISRERRQLRGVFSSEILHREAQLMLAEVMGRATIPEDHRGRVNRKPGPGWLQITPDPEARLHHLLNALADPEVAVILLDLVQGRDLSPDPIDALASALPKDRNRPLIIAHVCSTDPEHQAALEARLLDENVILMSSNASAARLAGMVVARKG